MKFQTCYFRNWNINTLYDESLVG